MRRHVLAAFVVTLVAVVTLGASTAPSAQSQDATLSSARTMAAQGNHDGAIALLRGALEAAPSAAGIRDALVEMLEAKRIRLQEALEELRGEVRALRNAPALRAGSSCDTQTPLQVGGAIKAPIKQHDVKPVYPPEARDARIGGIVVMEVTIGCDGTVIDTVVVRGVPSLTAAAVGAVGGWQYTPTLVNGTPIPVRMHVTITFTPNG
jgi:TonB family protein